MKAQNIFFTALCFSLFSIIIVLPLHAQKKQIKREFASGFFPGGGDKLFSDNSENIKEYDRKGRILKELDRRISANTNQEMGYRREYFYSDHEEEDSSIIYSDDKRSTKLVHEFDSTGKPVKIQEYLPDGTKSFYTKIYYDSSGNKSSLELYIKGDRRYNQKWYKYDKNKNLIDESGEEQGDPRYHWTYKYDKKGRLTQRTDKDGEDKLKRIHKYEYNKDGEKFKETVTNPEGKIERVVKYRYEYYE